MTSASHAPYEFLVLAFLVSVVVFLCLLAVLGWHRRKNRTSEDLWWREYRKYLLSRDWRQKRETILARSGGRCERCGNEGMLQVHHLTYERLRHELPFDLAALCYECHRAQHPGKVF